MDFDDTPAQAEFRASARAFLEANAERSLERRRFDGDAALVADARRWQAKKAAAGYAGIGFPRDYGGAGLGPIEDIIYREEEAHFATPFGVYEIGLGMCVPTLLALGGDAVKRRYVPPAIEGREIWCQLFSEPGAGSDLAALRTRAESRHGRWVVNGQKVWTTGTQFSDYGLLLARTDFSVPKHAGLTLFIVDMRAPGVEVRPIRQMTGGSEFNEVFLTDVEISDEHRLTEPGGGWAGARTTLMFERLNVGADIGLVDWRGMLELIEGTAGRDAGWESSPQVLDAIAGWFIDGFGLKLLAFRAITALQQGVAPGPEQSIAKLVLASQAQQMANFALDLRGQEGALAGSDLGPGWSELERAWSFGAAMRIAGGTDEILRNIIAERVLGLPAEPREDLGVPFDQIPS